MRNKFDYYPTPEWCYEKLPINWEQFSTAHEPCKGDGRIVSFLENKGIETSWSEIQEDKDYFEWNGEVDLILTNPPFSLAKEFIEHSMSCSTTVIMLLRINFLGAQSRYDFWQQFAFKVKRPPTSKKSWAQVLYLNGLPWLIYEFLEQKVEDTRRKI